jgi:hypothetical protein
MNAQKLWQGSDYAMGRMTRGQTVYPISATRVKVVKIEKKPIPGGQRDRTYVTVMILNDEGMPPNIESPERRTIVPRDLIDHWDNYLEEVGYDEREEWLERNAERERKREEERRSREERDAVYYIGNFLRGIQRNWEQKEARRLAQIEEDNRRKRVTRMENVLVARGFKREEFAVNGQTIQISTQAMERWLGFENVE